MDTNCCQLCQKMLTNLVSFLTFCSSWSLQCISAGTSWKHQGPLGRKYSWQLSGQTIATSLKTDSGNSVGKRCIFEMLFFCNFVIQLLSIFSPCNFDCFQSAMEASLSNVSALVLAHGASGHNHIAPAFPY